MAYYRPAKFGDCKVLAPNLRDTDKREVWASNGLSPLAALQFSFVLSEECNTIIDDNEDIIGMFGVTNCGTLGVPWLLMADESTTLGFNKEFVMQNREWVNRVQERYPMLANLVSQENTRAIKWLRLLGFKFIALRENYGVNPQPFYEFVRIRS